MVDQIPGACVGNGAAHYSWGGVAIVEPVQVPGCGGRMAIQRSAQVKWGLIWDGSITDTGS